MKYRYRKHTELNTDLEITTTFRLERKTCFFDFWTPLRVMQGLTGMEYYDFVEFEDESEAIELVNKLIEALK